MCIPLSRSYSSELTAWTPQTSIRDSSRLWSSTSDYHRHQHSNDRSPQHYARYQQPPGYDQVKTTERLHHRRSPDRCLSRSATGLHHVVNSSLSSLFYSVHGRFFVPVTHTLITHVYVLAILLVLSPMFTTDTPVRVTPAPLRRRSPNPSGTF